jgi:hypothetical protein
MVVGTAGANYQLVVVLETKFLRLIVSNDLHCCAISGEVIGHNRMQTTIPLHRLFKKLRRSLALLASRFCGRSRCGGNGSCC